MLVDLTHEETIIQICLNEPNGVSNNFIQLCLRISHFEKVLPKNAKLAKHICSTDNAIRLYHLEGV